MLTFNFVTYLRVNVIIHSWVLYTMSFFFFLFFFHFFFHFEIDGNEIVAYEQLNDSVDNCRSKAKLIDGDKLVQKPKDGMLFGSIEEFLEYYRNYAKQAGFGVVQKKKKKYENGYVHYITLTCAHGGKASSSK
jgi:hypothetical protein